MKLLNDLEAAGYGVLSLSKDNLAPLQARTARKGHMVGYAPEPRWLRDRILAQGPSAVVSEQALAGTSPLCTKALDLFVSIYGAEAGSLALKALAVGGVFVGGGIAPKIRGKLTDGTCITAFREKGRLSDLMASVPVHLVLDPRAPLLGAARIARNLLPTG